MSKILPLLLLVIACTQEMPRDPYARAAACEEIIDREMGACLKKQEEQRAANPNAHFTLHCEPKSQTQTGRACQLFLVNFRNATKGMPFTIQK